ncbi:MAG TPA: Rieske 2Fe-2S domain-containing protein [Chloroflexia bacterium]|jgi:nitrite reductase/ring-hydroxylating ferredoxin subunit|nr:Rieske 2Fe-2S domain-containing protein [Chloroflexia bacterium]
MYRNGWYQIGFERDLTQDLTPAAIGTRRVVLVRGEGGIRAFDSVCPHRGANLAIGGRLDREAIVCPFHGYRIGLGRECEHGFRVREYPALLVGGLVFVRLSDSHDNGFREFLEQLDQDHYFVPGFTMRVMAPPAMVVENAFDNSHFRPVHGIHNEPRFRILPSQCGEFAIEGVFEYGAIWRADRKPTDKVRVPFVARAFSPGIVLGQVGGDRPYFTVTCATPITENDCLVRFSLAVPAGEGSTPPSEEFCQRVLRESKSGLEQDQVIWENMSINAPCHYTAMDAAVLAFKEFCRPFEDAGQA